jgi:hypothetical protein
MKTAKRNIRTIDHIRIGNVRYSGYVRKVSEQFSGKWAEYTLNVNNDKTDKRHIASIRKLHKYWINDLDQTSSDNIDSQIRHCLEKFSAQDSRPINMAPCKMDAQARIPASQTSAPIAGKIAAAANVKQNRRNTDAKTKDICPECQVNDNIEYGPITIEGNKAFQECDCFCGNSFYEVYQFIGTEPR